MQILLKNILFEKKMAARGKLLDEASNMRKQRKMTQKEKKKQNQLACVTQLTCV